MGPYSDKFNMQAFLTDMRQEQKEDHDALTLKVDGIVDKLSDHETRIVVVENTHKAARWLGGAVVVAFLGFICDALFNHLPKALAALAAAPRP